MKEACKVIKQTTGDVVDLDTIPIDDELTYQLYQRGQTIGTFQFESPGMQKYLRELKPTVFEDLIAMNALYRPGPMDYIPRLHRPQERQAGDHLRYPLHGEVSEGYLRHHGLSGAGDASFPSAWRASPEASPMPCVRRWVRRRRLS